MPSANRLLSGFCLAYVGCVVIVWMLLWSMTDRWWVTTLFAFGPRWILLLPLPFLLLWTFIGFSWRFANRWIPLISIGLAALIVAGPIMGLHFRWSRSNHHPDAVRLRIVTCNVEGQLGRLPAFQQLVRDRLPQLIALQECAALSTDGWPGDWHVHRAGRLILASSYPLRDIRFRERRIPESRWPPIHALRAVVELPQGPLTVCCVHLRSPRHAITPILSRKTIIDPTQVSNLRMESIYRQVETQDIFAWLEDAEGPLLIVGDLNTPPESHILGTWRTQFTDAFAMLGRGYGYTKTTSLGPLRYGTRIDYVLCDDAIQPLRCWVDEDVGSDHLPLLADVEWVPTWGASTARRVEVDAKATGTLGDPAVLGIRPFEDKLDSHEVR